jgi:hypothetical protein
LRVDDPGFGELRPQAQVSPAHADPVGGLLDKLAGRGHELGQLGEGWVIRGQVAAAGREHQLAAEGETGQHARQRNLLTIDGDPHGEVEPVGRFVGRAVCVGGQLEEHLRVGHGLAVVGLLPDLLHVDQSAVADDRKHPVGEHQQLAAAPCLTGRRSALPVHIEPGTTGEVELVEQRLLGERVAHGREPVAAVEGEPVIASVAVPPPPRRLDLVRRLPADLEDQARRHLVGNRHGLVARPDRKLTAQAGKELVDEAGPAAFGHDEALRGTDHRLDRGRSGPRQ